LPTPRAIAERLVDAVHHTGGRVLTKVKATGVLVKDGRAVGVRVTKGKGQGQEVSTSCCNLRVPLKGRHIADAY
ncbi:unnamed protein product, partial [Discosporangium mesarthrocarpum]